MITIVVFAVDVSLMPSPVQTTAAQGDMRELAT